MLELKDFFHLPQLDALIEQLAAGTSGLTIVAGLDPRPATSPTAGDGFLPSGRATIFRILMRQILATHHSSSATIVTDDEKPFRLPRHLRRRIRLSLVEPPIAHADAIADAVRHGAHILVLDRLTPESAPAALAAAGSGVRVLSQLDTVLRGADVAQHLLDLGVPRKLLTNLNWVVAVRRVATLCPECKQPASFSQEQLRAWQCHYPALEQTLEAGTFYRSTGCPTCQYTGYAGDVMLFDIFQSNARAFGPLEGTSLLASEAYALGLAALGLLSLDDVSRLDADQLRHTYNLLAASERAQAEANAELQRRLAELEAANQVLQGRTEALISLHDVGQALITSTGLRDLGFRVCRHMRDLCGADRAILYVSRSDASAEVLAVSGWDLALVHQRFDADLVFGVDDNPEPSSSPALPPGVLPRHPDLEGVALRAGMRVPLIAQEERVGLMIVHTTHKKGFAPGEAALLQTFANQSAIAIQRAGLIERLQEKIAQLEAAQVELVKKQRMEREMELARQVQQSVLPRVFPLIPGYRFGAHNRPARQVGGDFYDVILLDGNRFGIVIADVSGKGMPAALYMALTRSLLLAEARRERSPRAVLNNVHRLLLELGEPDMFVTVFYGVVNAPARELIYVRAGHDRPLLLRGGKAYPLGGEGMFLGFPDLDELHLSEEQAQLMHGDKLVLYTDGLVDILSPEGQPFGQGRLQSTLLSHADLSPNQLCTTTFAELGAYQAEAEQYDDMTLLVVEVENRVLQP